jgi:hypothetical protein
MPPKTELQHHKEVTKWLKRNYPKMIFRTDYSAGLKLTIGQAKTHYALQSGRAYPDLWIAQPVGVYHGLYLELKKDGEKIILNDGTLTKDKHIREQAKVLEDLARLGYAAAFAVGHTQAKQIIKDYLAGQAIHPVIYQFVDHVKEHGGDEELPF